MRILRTKKAKLNFVIAAFLSCFCMMLVTPFIGEQFGFANSFSNIYLDGEHIGAIKDPANVETLLLDARLQLAKEQKEMILAEVDCYYTPVEEMFSKSMSEDELYDKLYDHLKNASVDIQRAYLMKIGTYTVYLNTIEDVYKVLDLAKEKFDPENRFQVNIIADDEREINMYTAELISSQVQVQDIETVGIRVSEIQLRDAIETDEPQTQETEEPVTQEPEEEVEEEEIPEPLAPEEDGLKGMAFGEKVEISEAYVSKA